MTSSIPEAEALQRSKSFNLLIFILVTSIALALSGDRVFASAQSVGGIDYDSLTVNECTANVFLPYASYVVSDGAYQLRVPVFLRFMTPIPTGDNWVYMSGLMKYSTAPTGFTFDTNTPVNIAPAYFESVENDNIRVAWSTSMGLRIYFDNYRIVGNTANEVINLGYLVYNFQVPSSTFTFNFTTSNIQNQTPTVVNVRLTAYEYGFAETIAYAINSSSDIDTIISWLSNISHDTDYLPSIMQNLSTNFQYTINWLSDISQSNYDLYILIRDYINDPDVGQNASEAAAMVGSQAAQEHAAQESLYALSPGNMNDLDGALNDFGLLDSVKNSTDFWGYCINQFSSRSGALWGIFIFGLILGLIAFILRLSK